MQHEMTTAFLISSEKQLMSSREIMDLRIVDLSYSTEFELNHHHHYYCYCYCYCYCYYY
jgi:hypothetical protein